MRRFLLSFLAVGLLAAPAADAREQLVRVELDNPRTELRLIERLGLDLTHHMGRTFADVIVRSDAEKALLTRHGLDWKVEEADLEAQFAKARAADRAYGARVLQSPLPSGRTEYRRYPDYLREMDELAAQYPGLVRKFTLPKKSVMGQDIVGLEISKDVNRTDDGKPAYVVMGLHHAREWPSGEVNMEFALDLARSFGTDERVTQLLERERVFVIPVINPDGFHISREDVQPTEPQFEGTANAGSNKRKNCAANVAVEEGEPCENRSGVDLNRNYAAYWGGNGASTFFPLDDYRGPAPWSEPETQAVHEFSQRLQITNFQTIHNVAALVLRPPGFRAQGLAPDEARMKALGDAMGAATGYSSEYGYQLYEVTGATEDWNYVAQGAFGYTIELGPESPFQGPYQTHVVDQYVGAGEYAGKGVREALILAGEQAANPVDHAVLAGDAPPGITLRLRKEFKTTTSPVCPVDVGIVDSLSGQLVSDPYVSTCPTGTQPILLDDFLDTTMTVPEDGKFTWHVNPSTRPFEAKNGTVEAWTLTCEAAGAVLHKRQIVVSRGETMEFNGLCGGGPSRTFRTPPDPAFAAFEARLAATSQTSAALASRAAARRGVRLVLGRVLTTRVRTLRKHRSIRIGVRMRGARLENTSFIVRNRDRQIVARTFKRRLKTGRTVVRIPLPKGLRRGSYRLTAKGFTTDDRAPIGAAARLIVRR